MNRDGCLSIVIATVFFIIFMILIPYVIGLTVQYYRTPSQIEVTTEAE